MNTSWMEVSQRQLNISKTSNVGGVKVQLMVSPWDIPEATRAGFDDEASEFFIEFKYLSDSEPRRYTQLEEGVRFEVGKNSGKIFKIMISKECLQAAHLDREYGDLPAGLEMAGREVHQYERSTGDSKAKVRPGNLEAINSMLSKQVPWRSAL